jgi:hypothetical protein
VTPGLLKSSGNTCTQLQLRIFDRKNMRKLFFIASLLLSAAASADPGIEAMQELHKERIERNMGELDFVKAQRDIVKRFYPEDYEAHTLAEYRLLLATRLEEKRITQAE